MITNGAVILPRSVRHVLLCLYDEAQRATTWHNVPQRGHCEASAWRQRGITPHNVGVIKGVKCHKTWRPIRDRMTASLETETIPTNCSPILMLCIVIVSLSFCVYFKKM